MDGCLHGMLGRIAGERRVSKADDMFPCSSSLGGYRIAHFVISVSLHERTLGILVIGVNNGNVIIHTRIGIITDVLPVDMVILIEYRCIRTADGSHDIRVDIEPFLGYLSLLLYCLWRRYMN